MTIEEARKKVTHILPDMCPYYCFGKQIAYPNCDFCREREALILADKALESVEKYKWHDLRKEPNDLPEAETEVDVVCERNGREIRTHGFYEDGTIHSDDSKWWWDEIAHYGTYCEKTDDYIIPCGWWEYLHYTEDNRVIDDTVIAWREIEPFEVDG